MTFFATYFCHQMFSTGPHICLLINDTPSRVVGDWVSTVSTPVSATPIFQIFTSCVSFTPVFGQLWHSHLKMIRKDEIFVTTESTLSVIHFPPNAQSQHSPPAYTGQMSATNLVSPAYLGLLPLLLPTCLCHELLLSGTGLLTVLLHWNQCYSCLREVVT